MYDGRSLRLRIPGQSVLSEVVRSYRLAPPRSRFARLFGVSPLSAESRAWYGGALGELVVGQVLDNLGPEWDVLHAVPAGPGGTDIDHLVIGPGGVFTVGTRNHAGHDIWINGSTFMVSEQRQPHISNALFDAQRASRQLSEASDCDIPVTAVIVLIDPRRLSIRSVADGVAIVPARELERWFDNIPRSLSGQQVADISDVADLSTTWDAIPGLPEQDTMQLYRDFAEIRSEVRSAVRRRVLWAVAGIVLVYGAVWASVASAAAALVP